MEAKPLVSVICVSMNHKNYIEQGVTSFVTQTYNNIEFLFIDNNSSDNSFEIADKIFKDSGRLYNGFKRENSHSLPANFNFLINKAKGKYLCFISCDDWMKVEFIETMVNEYELKPQTGLLYSNGWYYFEDTKTNVIAENKKFISGNIFDHIYLYGVLFPVGVMVKREIFEKVGLFDESIPIEDYDFWLRVAKNHEISYSSKPMLYYRKHSQSMTGLNGYKNIKYYLQIVEKYNSNKLYPKVCRSFRKHIIFDHFQNGENKKALLMIWHDFHFERFYFSVLVKLLFGKKYFRKKRNYV